MQTPTPLTTLRVTLAVLSVFSVSFAGGVGAGSLLLSQSSDSVFVSVEGGTSSSASSVRVKRLRTRARRIRGVPASRIQRPPSRRRSVETEPGSSETLLPAAPIKASCGDGLVLFNEGCDDRNVVAGDGCSATCTVETGYVCNSAQPSVCWSTCGDGVVASNERCDDGNSTAGDGCGATCRIDLGYVCSGSPSTCEVRPYCGDGIKASTEQCDDGNSIGGDGCFECKTE